MLNKCAVAFAAVLGLALPVAGANAQSSYPDRPIKLIIPFAPGGASDIVGRMIGQKLSKNVGQALVVDNRGGGGTVIGTDMAAKAAPDGYTLLMITPSFIINATGLRKLPFDPVKDFSAVTLLGTTPLILVANANAGIATVKELIALSKAQPNRINFASSGNGSPTHLGMEIFRMEGAKITHIPYKGAAPALNDLLSGRVQMMLTSIIAAQPHIKTGRLKPIAVTSAKRSDVLPEVPAIAETLPGYEVVNWWGIVAPAGTPKNAIGRLNKELSSIVREKDVRERFAREGAEPVGNPADEFAQYIKSEIAKWTKVVRETGVTLN